MTTSVKPVPTLIKYRRTFYAWRRKVRGFWLLYRSNKFGMIGLAILLVFIFISLFAPLIAPYGEWEYAVAPPFSPPSPEHLFGTDELGRDLFSLVVYGTRISLLIGFFAALLSAFMGGFIGIFSGYYGGIIDDILMRITDAFLVIPSIVLMIVLAAMLGTSINNIIIVIAITTWPGTARLVRSQVLSLKERPFVEFAKAVGAGDARIMFSHIFPNVLPLIFANMILGISGAILSEAGLSFLGLGDPHHTSWGLILHYASGHGAIAGGLWWYVVPPGICILLLVLAFIFIGYAMDEILNPKLRKR